MCCCWLDQVGKVVAIDIDDTLTETSGSSHIPNRPPQEAIRVIEILREIGKKIVLITGRQVETAREIKKMIGGCDEMVVEHGGYVFHKDEKNGTLLVPQNEYDKFELYRIKIIEFYLNELGADNVNTGHQYVAAFWSREEKFLLAQKKSEEKIPEFLKKTGLEETIKMSGWHKSDFSHNFFCKSLGKHQAIRFFRKNGHGILIAAGDSSGDFPLLYKAYWPIVCRSERHPQANVRLAKIVTRKGRGFVAQDEIHGYGFATGVNKFFEQVCIGGCTNVCETLKNWR